MSTNSFRSTWPTVACRDCRRDVSRDSAIRVAGRYPYNLCPDCVAKRRRLGALPPGVPADVAKARA